MMKHLVRFALLTAVAATFFALAGNAPFVLAAALWAAVGISVLR